MLKLIVQKQSWSVDAWMKIIFHLKNNRKENDAGLIKVSLVLRSFDYIK